MVLICKYNLDITKKYKNMIVDFLKIYKSICIEWKINYL